MPTVAQEVVGRVPARPSVISKKLVGRIKSNYQRSEESWKLTFSPRHEKHKNGGGHLTFRFATTWVQVVGWLLSWMATKFVFWLRGGVFQSWRAIARRNIRHSSGRTVASTWRARRGSKVGQFLFFFSDFRWAIRSNPTGTRLPPNFGVESAGS